VLLVGRIDFWSHRSIYVWIAKTHCHAITWRNTKRAIATKLKNKKCPILLMSNNDVVIWN
jgi:hypothetical protein